MRTTSVFIRTYPKDFPWVVYAVHSMRHFLTGCFELVIHVDEQDLPALEVLNLPSAGAGVEVRLIGAPVHHPVAYLNQQIAKFRALELCRGDQILFLDSDSWFQMPSTPASFCDGGKPTVLFRDWNLVGNAICWKAPTERAIKSPVPSEFLARVHQLFRTETLWNLERWFLVAHGTTLLDYIQTLKNWNDISEFNLMSAFAWFYERDRYVFLDANGPDCPPLFIAHYGEQRHSPLGLEAVPLEIREKLLLP